MAEKKIKVKVYQVTYICDACGVGEMVPTGVALMSNPPQYPHKCNKCGSENTLRSKYPKTVYEQN